MSRQPVRDSVVPVRPFDSPLTERQFQIIFLKFCEGWQIWKIAQHLRISPATVKRDTAEALIILQQTEAEMEAAALKQDGAIRLMITVERSGNEAKSVADATLQTVEKILRIPGYGEAYYAPDTRPEIIRAAHARNEKTEKEWQREEQRKKLSRVA